MDKQSSMNQIQKIAERIVEMRSILGYTTLEMAKMTDITEDAYISYETGTVDLPFTFLHKFAKVCGIELTDILEGHSAKLSGYTVTRRGEGLTTASEDGITIQDLAPLFRKKLATPYWVTYKYSEEQQNQPINTVTHSGQEFNMVIKGSMRIRIGDREEILREGDSIFFKSSTPHGQLAIGGEDCVFLAMVMASDTTDQAMFIAKSESAVSAQPLLCEKFIQTVENEHGALVDVNYTNEDEYNFAFDTVD